MSRLTHALLLIALFAATPARAETRPFGLGIILGDPTGITAKGRFGEMHSVQAHFGWGITGDHGESVTLIVDYVAHIIGAPIERAGTLYPTAGIGGKFSVREGKDSVALGLRVPVGAAFFISRVPIEIGVEIAVGIHLFPATSALVDGGLMARWYF